ncbi:hypothetical protein ETD83_00050 [Actinomadura soli]|uniref:Uncharacterized protein n=1 Tax=Actinomadura soli TaxID=2508997 RepID=A0A5C4JJZ0_9ACTN|nr:helix-turn-helix domain-containing protein [Actinomadura soli]TMR07418.1 hypothetical protein ETD83_00050 [Actinomadura soli]
MPPTQVAIADCLRQPGLRPGRFISSTQHPRTDGQAPDYGGYCCTSRPYGDRKGRFLGRNRPVTWVGLPPPLYNPGTQAKALETLLRKLPSPTAPVPTKPARNLPGRAKQLKEQEAQEVVAAYRAGASVYQIARRFHIHRVTVSKILRRHGVKMRMGGMSPEQIDEAVKLYQEGWSLARIGKRMSVDGQTVRSRLVERGVRMRDTHGRERP